MNLLLDVGNTAVTWALAEAARVGSIARFIHRDSDFNSLAAQAWSAIPSPEAVYVANVAGSDMATDITRFVTDAWQVAPEFVRVSEAACGVTNAYREPDELGVDRWAAMIGAFHSHNGAMCVVDCGTAITIDLLEGSGLHRGGLILPGIGLLGKTLQINTAGIQLQDDASSALLTGQGTRDGVIGGASYLAAAAIDRIVTDMDEVAGEPVTTIITGGDAERLLPLIEVPVQHEAGLVLQGLAIMSGEGS